MVLAFALFLLPLALILRRSLLRDAVAGRLPGRDDSFTKRARTTDLAESRTPAHGVANGEDPNILPFAALAGKFQKQREAEAQRAAQRTAAIVKAIRDRNIALQRELRLSQSAA
jgi:hypothetical protein